MGPHGIHGVGLSGFVDMQAHRHGIVVELVHLRSAKHLINHNKSLTIIHNFGTFRRTLLDPW